MIRDRVFIFHRKKFSMVISFSLLLFLFGVGIMLPHWQEQSVLSYALANRVIVVDPGHGGVDPGAISRNDNLEKDIVLDISRHLVRYLSQAGALVVCTRLYDDDLAGDEFTGSIRERKKQDMANRVEVGRRSKADLYISIHTNAESSRKWSGAQVFYYNQDEKGKRIAESIQAELGRVTGSKRKARGADYYLMKQNHMTTILVEVGFISHPREEQLLLSKDYQQKLAYAIFAGLAKAEIEKPEAKIRKQSGEVPGHLPFYMKVTEIKDPR